MLGRLGAKEYAYIKQPKSGGLAVKKGTAFGLLQNACRWRQEADGCYDGKSFAFYCCKALPCLQEENLFLLAGDCFLLLTLVADNAHLPFWPACVKYSGQLAPHYNLKEREK